MNVPEPKDSQLTRVELARQQWKLTGRWRWWYSSICDYRLTHPGCSNVEIGLHLKKHANTIGMIINTDLYREYEAQRRERWRSETENQLKDKLLDVTSLALDSMKAQIIKKQDQIPLDISREIAFGGLERLGFGPKPGPSVVVNNNQNLMLPAAVSPQMLDEARMALRAAEQHRLPSSTTLELEAGPQPGEATGLASHPEAESEPEGIADGPASTDS